MPEGFSSSATPASFVGFGCAGLMQIADPKGRQALLEAAYESGIRHFDVARMYGLGAAEGEVGRFIQDRRSEVTVTTKFGLAFSESLTRASKVQSVARWVFRKVPALRAVAKRRFAGNTERDFSVATARASVATSLERLGVDTIDFLLLHEPTSVDEIDPELPDYLASLRSDGTMRRFGVAGEIEVVRAALAKYPSLGDAVQVPADDEALRSPLLNTPGRDVFSFGHLQRNLVPLKEAVARASDKGRSLTDALGVETLTSEAIGASVLLHARSLNPTGRVLFFSSSPTRVRETMRFVSGGDVAATGAVVSRLLKESP